MVFDVSKQLYRNDFSSFANPHGSKQSLIIQQGSVYELSKDKRLCYQEESRKVESMLPEWSEMKLDSNDGKVERWLSSNKFAVLDSATKLPVQWGDARAYDFQVKKWFSEEEASKLIAQELMVNYDGVSVFCVDQRKQTDLISMATLAPAHPVTHPFGVDPCASGYWLCGWTGRCCPSSIKCCCPSGGDDGCCTNCNFTTCAGSSNEQYFCPFGDSD